MHAFFRKDGSRRFAEAMRSLEKGRADIALRAANALIESPDEADRISGYLCLAYVYEDGGAGVEQNLGRSLHYFRQVSLLVEHGDTLCNIARIECKLGNFDACLEYLRRAERVNVSPLVLLGLADYHRLKPTPELEVAGNYYLRAAVHGRFGGLFGYARTARDLGRPARAMAADIVRVSFGWLAALLIGHRANERFVL